MACRQLVNRFTAQWRRQIHPIGQMAYNALATLCPMWSYGSTDIIVRTKSEALITQNLTIYRSTMRSLNIGLSGLTYLCFCFSLVHHCFDSACVCQHLGACVATEWGQKKCFCTSKANEWKRELNRNENTFIWNHILFNLFYTSQIYEINLPALHPVSFLFIDTKGK